MTETPTGPDDAAPAPPEGGEPIPATHPSDARPPRRLEKTILAAVAGLAMAVPFVHDALGPLVFVSHVPFLFLVASGRYPAVRLASYLAGFVGMSLGVIWLWGVAPPLPFVGAAYFALYVLALGWAVGRTAGGLSLPLVVFYPPMLVASEYLRLRFSLFSTTWLDVAYPLHVWTDLIQIASLGGHHGVSLLVGVCQAAIVEGLRLVSR